MSTDLSNLLQTLAEAKVDFILVGGLAAVLHGAPTATFDVDIVPKRSEQNVDRLVRVLAQLHARYRGHPNRTLSPDRSALPRPWTSAVDDRSRTRTPEAPNAEAAGGLEAPTDRTR
jgi:hypothetical protein